MTPRTDEEIKAKIIAIWGEADERYGRPYERSFKRNSDGSIAITVSQMYEAPGLTFENLKDLAEFFGTQNINDDARFAGGGCETCDYGSEYGFTLTVRP